MAGRPAFRMGREGGGDMVTLEGIQLTLQEIRELLRDQKRERQYAREYAEQAEREKTRIAPAPNPTPRDFAIFANELTRLAVAKVSRKLELIAECKAETLRVVDMPSHRLQMTYQQVPPAYVVAPVLAAFHNSLTQWVINLRAKPGLNQHALSASDGAYGFHVVVEGPCADYACRITMMGR